jgi:hypothetical protein
VIVSLRVGIALVFSWHFGEIEIVSFAPCFLGSRMHVCFIFDVIDHSCPCRRASVSRGNFCGLFSFSSSMHRVDAHPVIFYPTLFNVTMIALCLYDDERQQEE